MECTDCPFLIYSDPKGLTSPHHSSRRYSGIGFPEIHKATIGSHFIVSSLLDKGWDGQYVIQSCEPHSETCQSSWTAAISLSIDSILTRGSNQVVITGSPLLNMAHSSIKDVCKKREQCVTDIDKMLATNSSWSWVFPNCSLSMAFLYLCGVEKVDS